MIGGSSRVVLVAWLTLAGPATAAGFENLGIGGGGAMFVPAASPHDPDLLFVACDMSGVYRSADGGKRWTLLDKRQLRSANRCPVTFDPADPRRVYAASEDGLKVSDDAGLTWDKLTDQPPAGTIVRLAVDPTRTDRLLAGTDRDAWLSEDRGETWVRLPGIEGETKGLFFGNGASPWAIGTTAGVWRKPAGSTKWEDATAGLPSRDLQGFCGGEDPDTGGVVWFAAARSRNESGRFTGGLYRSCDGGVAWTPVPALGLNTDVGRQDEGADGDVAQYGPVRMATGQTRVVYAFATGTGYHPPHAWTVFRSTDGGDTWTAVWDGDPRSPTCNLAPGWLPYDTNYGWGGPFDDLEVNDGRSGQVMGTNDGELVMTTTAGDAWRQLYTQPTMDPVGPAQPWSSRGLEVTNCWEIVFDPFDEARVYAGFTDIGFLRSVNRGASWTYRPKGSPWTNTFYRVICDPAVRGRLYAACSDQHDIPHWTQVDGARGGGGVCLSTDAGETWSRLGTGLPNAPCPSIALDVRSPKEARVLWAASYGHGVFRSEDGGRTWADVTGTIARSGNRQAYSVRIHPAGAVDVCVTGLRKGSVFGPPGGLFRSINNGRSWQCLTAGWRPLWPGDFCVHPAKPNTIWITTAGTPRGPDGGVWKTDDGGGIWRHLPLEYPKELQDYCHDFFVSLHPKDPDTVYAGVISHGLFVSHDGGESWKEVKGLPFTACQRVTVDPLDWKTLWVGTFGAGIWRGVEP